MIWVGNQSLLDKWGRHVAQGGGQSGHLIPCQRLVEGLTVRQGESIRGCPETSHMTLPYRQCGASTRTDTDQWDKMESPETQPPVQFSGDSFYRSKWISKWNQKMNLDPLPYTI